MKLNPIDFQIQTSASDGKHSPRECAQIAQKNGCIAIAITDHDTVRGVAEAIDAGRELGIRVIPGIEMSVEEHHMHLLGLGIDSTYAPLVRATAQFAEARIRGAQQMVRNLAAEGFHISWDDVLREANGAIITRPHIADAILNNPQNQAKLGGVTTKHEFFKTFLSDTSPAYVHRSNIRAREAIKLIHDAGGVAVWSHPPIPEFVGDCVGLENFLRELISYDLDGLELFGPSLSEADFMCLEKLTLAYKLLVSAGSDFHEETPPNSASWPRSAATIGEFPTYGRGLDTILPEFDRALEQQRQKGNH